MTAGLWFLGAMLGRLILPDLMSAVLQWIGQNAAAQSGLMSDVIFKAVFLVLPVARFAIDHEESRTAMRWQKPSVLGSTLSMLIGCVGAMLGARLSWLTAWVMQSLGGRVPMGISPQTPFALFVMLIFYALMPAVCEELFFRGGLMSAWERKGTGKALLIVSGLFALLHASPTGMPIQWGMGIVLGLCAVWDCSIFDAMIAHFSYNALTLVLAFVQKTDSTVFGAEFMLGTAFWGIGFAILLGIMRYTARCGFAEKTETRRLNVYEALIVASGILIAPILLARGLL